MDLAERVKYVICSLADAFDFNNHVTRFAVRLQELAHNIKSTRRKNRIQIVENARAIFMNMDETRAVWTWRQLNLGKVDSA